MNSRYIVSTALLIAAVIAFFILRTRKEVPGLFPSIVELHPAPGSHVATNSSPPEQMDSYGLASSSVENDLRTLAGIMDNALLMLKSAAERPLGGNEDWASLLLGKNAAKEVFLSASHPALNAEGQLVDRWKTPLFIHAQGAMRFDIRTAGPDKLMWTEDDLHLLPGGDFHRGPKLPEQER